MPSLAQLQAEPWWGREIVTAELSWLGAELCRRTGRPRDAFGSKGNEAHLNGGHRSQEWIKNSEWCTNTSYTVQSGLSGEQPRHIAACDFTPGVWGSSGNRTLMAKYTKALFDAARTGRLAGVRQIFGTLNGTSAIGLNVVSNSLAYPDDSHLDHLHLTFDRTRMRDSALMARIADTLTGDDMNAVEWNTGWMAQRVLLEDADEIVIPPNSEVGASGYRGPNQLKRRLVALEAKVDKLSAPAPVEVDYAKLAEALRPIVAQESEAAVRKVLGTLDQPPT